MIVLCKRCGRDVKRMGPPPKGDVFCKKCMGSKAPEHKPEIKPTKGHKL